jgi:hypothetical protein
MSRHISICDQCLNPIPKGNKIYRAFDSTVCSDRCHVELYNLIKKHDPKFQHPRSWKCLTDLDEIGNCKTTHLPIVHSRPLRKTVSSYRLSEICIQKDGTDSPIPITSTSYSSSYSIDKCAEFINNISLINILPYIQNGTSFVQERVNTVLGY